MSKNIGIGEVRTKLLDTDHKQWNCGMGLYDPSKVFFREDADGKVYVDGKLCRIVTNAADANLVKIGDKMYKFVTIGDQVWLAENLELPFANTSYYNNDPSQSYGLLYRGQDMGTLNDYLLENNVGWHVPTLDEINTLITNAGGQADAGTHLKSTTSWDSGNGDNSTGFDMKAAGIKTGATYGYKGTNGSIWSCVLAPDLSTPSTNRMSLGVGTGAYTNTLAWGFAVPVRLTKDTEPVEIGGKTYKTVRIGNQLWMMENLDYIFEGLNVGGATLQSDVHAWYFNNDPAQSEGLLYNGYAAKYLADHPELLPEGWKVPEPSDFGVLQVAVGGANTAGTQLKTPGTMGGINAYRFNGLATGMVRSSGAFTDRTTYLRLWTPSVSRNDDTAQQFLTLESDKATATVVSFANDKTVAYSIRLVKNLTSSDSKGLLSTVVVDEGKEDEKPIEDEKETEPTKSTDVKLDNDDDIGTISKK